MYFVLAIDFYIYKIVSTLNKIIRIFYVLSNKITETHDSYCNLYLQQRSCFTVINKKLLLPCIIHVYI